MADDTTLSADEGTRNQANSTNSSTAGASKTTLDHVKETATGLLDSAADAARNAASEGKDKATEALQTVSKVVDNAASLVEEKIGPTYGGYARRAAAGVEEFASSLENKDVDALIGDARDFVRNNPLIAVGAAAAIGFALTRVVKLGGAEISNDDA